MKRKLVMGLMIVVTVILQCVVFQIFEVASIKPDLMIILTASFALMCGRKTGMYTGFAGGLLMDILFPGTIGFHALAYMWVGYCCGYYYRIFYDDDIKTPLLLCGISDLAYGFYCYVFLFLLRGRSSFLFYLGRIILPEVIYTLMMTLVFYAPIYRINQWLSKSDKRSMDRFA